MDVGKSQLLTGGKLGVGEERMSPAEGHGQGLRNKVPFRPIKTRQSYEGRPSLSPQDPRQTCDCDGYYIAQGPGPTS